MTTLTESFWPADTSVPLRNRTVGDVLREAADDAPGSIALVAGAPGDHRRWTFAQLLADAERVAAALLARFEPGERIAVWAPNIPEWVLLEFGTALAGMVLVTVNPAYQRGELAHVLRQSGAAGLFLVPEWRGNPMLASAADLRPELPSLREILQFTEWDAFCASGSSMRLPAVGPDDPAQIQYTSGTTGFPKGALLRHGGLTDNATMLVHLVGLDGRHVYINPMPMFHTGGCVLGALGSVVARATHVPVLSFDPGFVLELIERERGTFMVGVPTMFMALAEHPNFTTSDLSSLVSAVSGGSLVPAELVRSIQESLGVQFGIIYGTTECSPLVSMTRFDDSDEDKARTIGRALPRTEIKIVDTQSGETVPPDTVGELCTRGYHVMLGYFEDPDATAEVIDPDGWYHTGDLAAMDSRGYCRIEGRLKDMIIRGGENVYPREIEDVLFTHPAVSDAAVVGVPDERWGEQVAAFIRCRDLHAAAKNELRAELTTHVREQLAGYKTPRHWVFLEDFPLTASGKVQKYVLRERFVKGEFDEALAP